jgi:flagellar hook-basal body complex protein FliE
MTDFAAIRSSAAVQSAYGKTRSLEKLDPSVAGGPEKQSFSQMVSNATTEAVHTVREGDAMAIAGLNGQAGIQQVVEATMAMESAVKVSVAVRDKLVEAYQEIMRMPV